jgi:hypothetical protein
VIACLDDVGSRQPYGSVVPISLTSEIRMDSLPYFADSLGCPLLIQLHVARKQIDVFSAFR